ncbi:sulfate adenylyltransferase subunit 1 [Simplicispira psychrophila]|uniref:sulfate adenylyltransferase subunit 1 n=1 Tax=Simplicispira psychrophila TaxID=80882 RepID=UPI00055A69C7|nr:GTP-binding protein [Simplicispira psychrophila]
MTTTTELIAASVDAASATGKNDHFSALRFITCGSVDDGKSTLIGRLLVDSKAVLQDHLAGVQRAGETDLALLTDGLSAEREQGITIDVAYRYFATESRKFIIGDAPGHAQYTRNMVTAASQADAAVVLVDATKLDWKNPQLALLEQTRRHSLLVHLLRVPSLVFAVNKLDAVENPELAWQHISAALAQFAQDAGIAVRATVPVSALKGWNVVTPRPDWCGYAGPSLLQWLEQLPTIASERDLPLAFPVQWVEKFASSADTSQGRRVFWGRVATGTVAVGAAVQIFPSGQTASVAQVLDHARRPGTVAAGQSAGLVLDKEVDVSRGDWIVATASASAAVVADDDFDTPVASTSAWPAQREISATVAWMDDEPLVVGRVYWVLHGHRWVKTKVQRVLHRLNVHTLAEEDADTLAANAIGQVQLLLQEALPTAPFAQSRVLGSLILVDTASHRTAAAVLVQ